jgi:DNA-binding PadR family transcriptional regulator
MAAVRDVSSVLPLGASAFHILLSIADGEKHGYSISRQVEEATEGNIRLMPGALYRYLKQMVTDGWIVETMANDDEGGRRRYYRLTPWGRRIAEAEAARLEQLVRMARRLKLLPARGAGA